MNARHPRVLWLVPNIPAGGVASVCLEASRAMSAIPGCEVTLAVAHACDPNLVVEAPLNVSVLDLAREPAAAASGFSRWLAAHPQDVILFNDCPHLDGFIPYVPVETSVIYVIHDEGYRYWRSALEYRASLDAIVTVSRFMQEMVRRKLGNYDGILTAILNGCRPQPPRSGKLQEGAPIRLLFCGSMEAFKGVSDLPRILRHLVALRVPFSLTVLGGRDEAWERACRRAAPQATIGWPGLVSRERCLEAYLEADVFLAPTRREPFGMVVLEAMASGCVPIGYDIESGLREIVADSESGFLVELGDCRAVAHRVRKLATNRRMLADMSEAGVRRARTEFSAEAMGRAYRDLIDQIGVLRSTRLPRRDSFERYRPGPARKHPYHYLPSALRSHIRRFVEKHARLAYALRRWRF